MRKVNAFLRMRQFSFFYFLIVGLRLQLKPIYTCIFIENVSLNASTHHKNGTGSTLSSLGVDGNVSSCSVTANGVNGWWMAKLQDHRVINKMYLVTGKLTICKATFLR